MAVYGHGILVNDNDLIRNAFDTFHAELIESECFAEENYHVLVITKLLSYLFLVHRELNLTCNKSQQWSR